MPYYLRLFSPHDMQLSLSQLKSCVPADVAFHVESGSPADLQSVLLSAPDGKEICLLEKASFELLQDEITEFIEELLHAEPKNAAQWVTDFLRKGRLLISCQVLEAGFDEPYGSVPGEALFNLKELIGVAVIQADGEGFSNTDGYHVVWQFSDDVTGLWRMAVRDESGGWTAFEMDLGLPEHRRAFCNGDVPIDATLL